MINGFKKSDFTKEQFEIIRDGLLSNLNREKQIQAIKRMNLL